MILRAPGFKDHLSYVTTFPSSQEWSLNTGLTVLWMRVMLDFICIVIAELLAWKSKRKLQYENICLEGIEPATLCFPAHRSSHSAIETVNNLLLKL